MAKCIYFNHHLFHLFLYGLGMWWLLLYVVAIHIKCKGQQLPLNLHFLLNHQGWVSFCFFYTDMTWKNKFLETFGPRSQNIYGLGMWWLLLYVVAIHIKCKGQQLPLNLHFLLNHQGWVSFCFFYTDMTWKNKFLETFGPRSQNIYQLETNAGC